MSDAPQQVYGGRYELQRRIARGGMAEVFLARDQLLDRPVALKVLFPELSADPSFVERFRREAQAAANLNHPNIVGVYDWGENDGTYFIVMELVDGRSLSQIVREEGRLQPERAADVTAETAGALAFAHTNGVIHRDVKPGNILIGPGGVVKVTDFGIARAVTTAGNLTQTGTVMGTATYFSPEQARGESVDPRSDVYSLGVVLYELLVGSPPFSGDNPVSVAYKHVQEPPVPPRARNAAIPLPLEAITLKALAKDPDARYGSADELRADLRRFRTGQQVVADAVLAPEPEPTSATRAVVPAAAATTAVPRATETVRRVEERYEPDEHLDDGRSSRSTGVVVAALLGLLVVLGLLLFFFSQSLGLGGDDAAAQVEVPTVISLPAAQATSVVAEAGLEPEIQEEPNDAVPVGTVFAQEPSAGVRVDEGSTVILRVSAGAPPVAVPDLVGLNLEDAVNQLEGLGLTPDVAPTESDRPEGEVLDQEPAVGEEVPAGSSVALQVSSGPPLVEIPDVVGLTSNQAGVELGRAGFEVVFTEERGRAPAGQVTRTDPAAGTELAEGETVTVFTSSGRTAVPNVLGQARDAAVAALDGAGFEVAEAQRTVVDPAQDGVVVAQDPGGGGEAEAGSTVTITVGRFVAPATTTTTAPTTTTTTTAPTTTTEP